MMQKRLFIYLSLFLLYVIYISVSLSVRTYTFLSTYRPPNLSVCYLSMFPPSLSLYFPLFCATLLLRRLQGIVEQSSDGTNHYVMSQSVMTKCGVVTELCHFAASPLSRLMHSPTTERLKHFWSVGNETKLGDSKWELSRSVLSWRLKFSGQWRSCPSQLWHQVVLWILADISGRCTQQDPLKRR
jgi:hypothetical protein